MTKLNECGNNKGEKSTHGKVNHVGVVSLEEASV